MGVSAPNNAPPDGGNCSTQVVGGQRFGYAGGDHRPVRYRGTKLHNNTPAPARLSIARDIKGRRMPNDVSGRST